MTRPSLTKSRTAARSRRRSVPAPGASRAFASSFELPPGRAEALPYATIDERSRARNVVRAVALSMLSTAAPTRAIARRLGAAAISASASAIAGSSAAGALVRSRRRRSSLRRAAAERQRPEDRRRLRCACDGRRAGALPGEALERLSIILRLCLTRFAAPCAGLRRHRPHHAWCKAVIRSGSRAIDGPAAGVFHKVFHRMCERPDRAGWGPDLTAAPPDLGVCR